MMNLSHDPKQAQPETPPLRLVFWETTQACNLACKHCRASAVEYRDPNELSVEESCKMMDSWPALGMPVLVFSGGEPLMRPDIWELLAEAKARGITFAVSTNGTMVDESIADRLATFSPAPGERGGLHRVSISLDGADAETHDTFRNQVGAFDKSVRAGQLLTERGIGVQINTSATRHNVDQIPATLELAVKNKFVAWHIFMLVPVGCGLDIPEEDRMQAAQYERTLKWFVEAQANTNIEMKATCAPHVTRVARQYAAKNGLVPKVSGHPGGPPSGNAGHVAPQPTGHPGGHPGAKPTTTAHPSAQKGKGCLAGTGICFVSRFGQIQGCGYMPVKAGNLREQTLDEIWNNSIFFNMLRDPENLEGKCGACEYADTCMGCRARAFSKTGDPFEEEPLCAYIPQSKRPAAAAG